jgi:hypothetical protein
MHKPVLRLAAVRAAKPLSRFVVAGSVLFDRRYFVEIVNTSVGHSEAETASPSRIARQSAT